MVKKDMIRQIFFFNLKLEKSMELIRNIQFGNPGNIYYLQTNDSIPVEYIIYTIYYLVYSLAYSSYQLRPIGDKDLLQTTPPSLPHSLPHSTDMKCQVTFYDSSGDKASVASQHQGSVGKADNFNFLISYKITQKYYCQKLIYDMIR